MGVVTDLWNLTKGSFDFDPATPGIFGGGADGGFSSLPDMVGGLYNTYAQYQAAQATPLTLVPPSPGTAANPYPNVGSLPTTGRPTVGCISQRDIQIAQVAGTSPEMVDLVLKLGRRNRRRPRMLTKSDIADISTMKAILGGGKAFELWLAKATH